MNKFYLRDNYGAPARHDRAERLARYGIVLIVAVMAFVAVLRNADAQSARTATITFTRPAKYVDGTDIAAGTVISYNVYQGAKGSTGKAKVATITATATTINTGLQPGETCWQITAVANGVESAQSGEACKTFAFPATEPVTITVT